MAYETEFASALDKKVKDYIAASQQGVDPGTKARMAQAGAADAAAVEAARVPPGGAPAQAAPKPGFGAKVKNFAKAAITPGTYNPNLGTLAKGTYRLAKGIATRVAPVTAAIDAMSDSQDEVKRVATMTDNPFTGKPLDYNSFFGRLGANAVNYLQKVGEHATFGVASRDRMERMMGGGNFFADDPPPAAPVPADMQPDGSRRGTLGEPAPLGPNDIRVPAAGFTLQGGESAPQQEAPTGVTDQPGGVQRRFALGPPEAYGGYIEGPNGRVELPSGTVQRFGVRRRTVGDSFNESLAERRGMEKSDVNSRALAAGAQWKTANARDAKQDTEHMRKRAADEYLKENPGDWGGYVTILSGRDPKEITTVLPNATGQSTAIDRNGRTLTPRQDGNVARGQVWDNPPPNLVEAMRKNRNSPAHRAEFLRRYGPENYEAALK